MEKVNEILIKRYKSHFKAFKKYQERSIKNHKAEDIHQMRLSIKKQRAILALVELCDDQFSCEKYEEQFKVFFKQAGRIRETQINLGLVKKTKKNVLTDYRKYQAKLQDKEIETFCGIKSARAIRKLDRLNDKLYKAIRSIPSKKIEKRTKKYLVGKLQQVDRLNKKRKDDERLHKIRIHLKSAAEIADLSKNGTMKSPVGRFSKQVTSINVLLGDWHDIEVLNHSVQTFNRSRNNKKRNKGLKRFVKVSERNNKHLEKKIEKRIPKLRIK